MDTNKKEIQDKEREAKKARVIEVLREFDGVIKYACHEAKISRSTFYNWKETDPEFKAQVDEIAEEATDEMEYTFLQKCRGVKAVDQDGIVYKVPPDTTALIFYLKTKGKDRGYTEKQTFDIGSIDVNVTVVE
jgi:hypothetical protein